MNTMKFHSIFSFKNKKKKSKAENKVLSLVDDDVSPPQISSLDVSVDATSLSSKSSVENEVCIKNLKIASECDPATASRAWLQGDKLIRPLINFPITNGRKLIFMKRFNKKSIYHRLLLPLI